MSLNGSGWGPIAFKRFLKFYPTSLCTSLIETDQGFGYLKGLGNPEGPHCLSCELVGTSLADWLGAPTLDWSLLLIKRTDEIPIKDGHRILAGYSFITRAEPGATPWGGDEKELEKLANPAAITQLVILDTWTRNCDRFAPDGRRRNRDNVLFIRDTTTKKPYRLVAMDFSHAFTCGHELTKKMGDIDYVRDERLYGLFPEFRPFIARSTVTEIASKLGTFKAEDATAILGRIPSEWGLDANVRSAWGRLIVERARFLAANVENILTPQFDLNLGDGNAT